jgi:hypothetical protein
VKRTGISPSSLCEVPDDKESTECKRALQSQCDFNYLSELVRNASFESLKTIVVQIGNSDNKLPQAQWAEFVRRVNGMIREHAKAVHFFGGTENWAAWQRVCWVFDCEGARMAELRSRLTATRKEFRQDAAALTEGETEFI